MATDWCCYNWKDCIAVSFVAGNLTEYKPSFTTELEPLLQRCGALLYVPNSCDVVEGLESVEEFLQIHRGPPLTGWAILLPSSPHDEVDDLYLTAMYDFVTSVEAGYVVTKAPAPAKNALKTLAEIIAAVFVKLKVTPTDARPCSAAPGCSTVLPDRHDGVVSIEFADIPQADFTAGALFLIPLPTTTMRSVFETLGGLLLCNVLPGTPQLESAVLVSSSMPLYWWPACSAPLGSYMLAPSSVAVLDCYDAYAKFQDRRATSTAAESAAFLDRVANARKSQLDRLAAAHEKIPAETSQVSDRSIACVFDALAARICVEGRAADAERVTFQWMKRFSGVADMAALNVFISGAPLSFQTELGLSLAEASGDVPSLVEFAPAHRTIPMPFCECSETVCTSTACPCFHGKCWALPDRYAHLQCAACHTPLYDSANPPSEKGAYLLCCNKTVHGTCFERAITAVGAHQCPWHDGPRIAVGAWAVATSHLNAQQQAQRQRSSLRRMLPRIYAADVAATYQQFELMQAHCRFSEAVARALGIDKNVVHHNAWCPHLLWSYYCGRGLKCKFRLEDTCTWYHPDASVLPETLHALALLNRRVTRASSMSAKAVIKGGVKACTNYFAVLAVDDESSDEEERAMSAVAMQLLVHLDELWDDAIRERNAVSTHDDDPAMREIGRSYAVLAALEVAMLEDPCYDHAFKF
jgi:hypothetical protein